MPHCGELKNPIHSLEGKFMLLWLSACEIAHMFAEVFKNKLVYTVAVLILSSMCASYIGQVQVHDHHEVFGAEEEGEGE